MPPTQQTVPLWGRHLKCQMGSQSSVAILLQYMFGCSRKSCRLIQAICNRLLQNGGKMFMLNPGGNHSYSKLTDEEIPEKIMWTSALTKIQIFFKSTRLFCPITMIIDLLSEPRGCLNFCSLVDDPKLLQRWTLEEGSVKEGNHLCRGSGKNLKPTCLL